MNYFAQRLIAFVFFLISLPFLGLVWFAIKIEDGGPLFFKQKRAGKDKKPFTIYKIRTMIKGAEKLKRKYLDLNEADGPVFKIRDDPRYTRIGKMVARTGLDELPQLINIIRGDMTFVGPRPLPVDEAKRVPKKYNKRFEVAPGITSPWVVKGTHRLSFDEWMKLDLEYVKNKNCWQDLAVMFSTARLMIKWTFLSLLRKK